MKKMKTRKIAIFHFLENVCTTGSKNDETWLTKIKNGLKKLKNETNKKTHDKKMKKWKKNEKNEKLIKMIKKCLKNDT